MTDDSTTPHTQIQLPSNRDLAGVRRRVNVAGIQRRRSRHPETVICGLSSANSREALAELVHRAGEAVAERHHRFGVDLTDA